MAALDVIGAALIAACLVLVGFIARRHLLVRRGGTVEMSWRRGHWTFGIGRYERDRLDWFRTFSLSPRPRYALMRGSVQISSRRQPRGAEAWSLVPEAIVLECATHDGFVEVALPASAVVGFLAWLESSPTRTTRTTRTTRSGSPTAPR